MLLLTAAALTGSAQWITDVFFQLDKTILAWYHSLSVSAGQVLTPIADIVSWSGWKGLFLILLALVLIAIPKTRRTGMAALLALALGALLVNIIIKPLVARPRPYNFDPDLKDWFEYTFQMSFSRMEKDFCFPSGHMNAATALCAAVVFTRGKKWIPVCLLYVVLMGMSRNYLIVHYPSDVFFAFFTGVIAAILACLIVRAVYKKWGNSRFLREPVKGAHEA